MRLNRMAAALALVLVLTAVMLGVGSAVDQSEETAAVPSQAGYYAGTDETTSYATLQEAYAADTAVTSFTAYNTNGTVGDIVTTDSTVVTGLTLNVYGTLTLTAGTTSFTTITAEANANLTSPGFTVTNLTVGAGATLNVDGVLTLTGTATSLNAAADSTVSIGTLSLGTKASTASLNFNNGGSAYSQTAEYALIETLTVGGGSGTYTISLTGLAEVNDLTLGHKEHTYLDVVSADTNKTAGLIVGANGPSSLTGTTSILVADFGTLLQSTYSVESGANLYLAGNTTFDLFYGLSVFSTLNAIVVADTSLTIKNDTGEINTDYSPVTMHELFETLTFGRACTLTIDRDLFTVNITTDNTDGTATIKAANATSTIYANNVAGGTLDLAFDLPCIMANSSGSDVLSVSSDSDGQITFKSLTDWASGNGYYVTMSGNITATSYYPKTGGVDLGGADPSSIQIDKVTDSEGATGNLTVYTLNNTKLTVGSASTLSLELTECVLLADSSLTADTVRFGTLTLGDRGVIKATTVNAAGLTAGAGAKITVTDTFNLRDTTSASLIAAADSTVNLGTLNLNSPKVSLNFSNGNTYSADKTYPSVGTVIFSNTHNPAVYLGGLLKTDDLTINDASMGAIQLNSYINADSSETPGGLIISGTGSAITTPSGSRFQFMTGADLYLAGDVNFDLSYASGSYTSIDVANVVATKDIALSFVNQTGEVSDTKTNQTLFKTLNLNSGHKVTVSGKDLFADIITANSNSTLALDDTLSIHAQALSATGGKLEIAAECILQDNLYGYNTAADSYITSTEGGQVVFDKDLINYRATTTSPDIVHYLSISGNVTIANYFPMTDMKTILGTTEPNLESSIRIDNVLTSDRLPGSLSITGLNTTKLVIGKSNELQFSDLTDAVLQTGSSLQAASISITAPSTDNLKLLIKNGCTISAGAMFITGTVQVGDPAEAGSNYTQIDLYGMDGDWLTVSDTLTLWCVLNLDNGGVPTVVNPSSAYSGIYFNYRMDGEINTITMDGMTGKDYVLDPYSSDAPSAADYTDPVAVYCSISTDLPDMPQAIMFDLPTGEGEFVGWSYNGTTYEYQDITTEWATFHCILGVKASYAVPLEFVSVWKVTDHTVTATAGAGGSIDPAGATKVKDGESLTVTFAADSGYRIAGVTVDGTAIDSYNDQTGGSYTFTNVKADSSISVTFTNLILISVNSSVGGTVSPSDSLVAPGSDLTLTFAAADLYALGDITVDGVSVGTPDSYTLENITAPHTVYVSFIITSYTVNYNVTCSSAYNAVIFSPEQRLVQQNMPFTVQMEAASGYTIAAIAVNGTTYKTFSEKTTEVTFTLAHVVAETQIYVTAVPITNVYITPYSYDVTVTGGGSVQVGTIVWNANEGNPVRVKMDSIKLLSDENQEVTYRVTSNNTQWSAGYESVTNNDSVEFLIDIAASEYSSGGYAKLLLNFVVTENPGADAEIAGQAIMQAVVINITIIPAVTTIEGYGLLFGQFDSPFGPSLDDPSLMAALSLLLLLLLLLIVLYEVYPRLKRQMERRRVPRKTKSSVKSAVGLLIAIYLIYTVHLCIYIHGASFRFLAYASMISNALYVLLIAGLIMLLVEEVRVRVLKKYAVDDSLLPLIFSLIKITVVIGAAALTCQALGTDLAYIVASLGILTTALGFGFKSTLTRILDGLIMNANRNFNTGDIIRIGGSEQVLRIVHIGIMTTTLTDWLNPSEKYMMPNDKLETAQVVNMTRGGNNYRVSIVVDVVHQANIQKMKEVLLRVANENEHVVKDGSVPLPDTQVVGLGASAIQIRLRAYVDDKETYLNLAAQLRERISELVRDGTIDMPYDQLSVNIGRAGPEEAGPNKAGNAAEGRNMGVKE